MTIRPSGGNLLGYRNSRMSTNIAKNGNMEICNCGRSFESKRSLSSHARFCKDYVKTRKPRKYVT